MAKVFKTRQSAKIGYDSDLTLLICNISNSEQI